jgi:hypothetical protein
MTPYAPSGRIVSDPLPDVSGNVENCT